MKGLYIALGNKDGEIDVIRRQEVELEAVPGEFALRNKNNIDFGYPLILYPRLHVEVDRFALFQDGKLLTVAPFNSKVTISTVDMVSIASGDLDFPCHFEKEK